MNNQQNKKETHKANYMINSIIKEEEPQKHLSAESGRDSDRVAGGNGRPSGHPDIECGDQEIAVRSQILFGK